MILKRAYDSTSKRLRTRTTENVQNLHTALSKQKYSTVTVSQNVPTQTPSLIGLVKHGEFKYLQESLSLEDKCLFGVIDMEITLLVG